MVPHKLLIVACLFSLVIIVPCQEDKISLSLSNNPVYTGQQVVILCRIQRVSLFLVTIDGFNGTRKEGSLSCSNVNGNQTATGIFSGHLLQGCPPGFTESMNIAVTITASTTTALDFRCTAAVVNDSLNLIYMTSVNALLQVCSLPENPLIRQNPKVFYENDNAIVTCESRNGKPSSTVLLTIHSLNGLMTSAIGNESISVTLPPPVQNWYNSTATCSTTNHLLSNTTTINISVGVYILESGRPSMVYTNAYPAILDCAAYVSSIPSPSYRWSVPASASVMQELLLSSPSFVALQGQFGLFNCTATNTAARESVVVLFSVANDASQTDSWSESSKLWIVVGLLIAVIGLVTSVFGVLSQQWFLKSRKNTSASPKMMLQGTMEAESTSNARSLREVEVPLYDIACRRSDDDHTYTSLCTE